MSARQKRRRSQPLLKHSSSALKVGEVMQIVVGDTIVFDSWRGGAAEHLFRVVVVLPPVLLKLEHPKVVCLTSPSEETESCDTKMTIHHDTKIICIDDVDCHGAKGKTTKTSSLGSNSLHFDLTTSAEKECVMECTPNVSTRPQPPSRLVVTAEVSSLSPPSSSPDSEGNRGRVVVVDNGGDLATDITTSRNVPQHIQNRRDFNKDCKIDPKDENRESTSSIVLNRPQEEKLKKLPAPMHDKLLKTRDQGVIGDEDCAPDEKDEVSMARMNEKGTANPLVPQYQLQGNSMRNKNSTLVVVVRGVAKRTITNATYHNESSEEVAELSHKRQRRTNSLHAAVDMSSIKNEMKAIASFSSAFFTTIARPKNGERFRVRFKVNDFSGHTRDTWYFGTATGIKKIHRAVTVNTDCYSIMVKYDDTISIQEEYPHKDCQKLLSIHDNGHDELDRTDDDELVYAIDHSSGKRVIAYHSNPKELVVGDLVQCHFQNGIEGDKWHQGRVETIHRDGKLNVHYFDGDLECNIPLSKANVQLLERGSSLTGRNWLMGAIIERKTEGISRRGTPNVYRGKIIDVATEFNNSRSTDALKPIPLLPFIDQSVFMKCKVRFPGGKVEIISYMEVVEHLFAACRRKYGTQTSIKYWPVTEDTVSTVSREKIDSKAKMSTPSSTICTKRSTRRSAAQVCDNTLKDNGFATKLQSACHKNKVEHILKLKSNESLQREFHVKEETQINFRSKRKKVKGLILETKFEDMSNLRIYEPMPHSLTHISYTENDDQEAKPLEQNMSQDSMDCFDEEKSKESGYMMNPAMANSLWRALNTPEPHIGSGLLMQMESVLNTTPNTNLAQNLIEFVTRGNKKEGTHFHDPNRTELVSIYLRTMLGKLYKPTYASAPKIAPTTWTEVKEILSLPIFHIDNSTMVCTCQTLQSSSTVRRLGLELQLSSKSLSFISKLFMKEIQLKNTGSYASVRSQPLCKAILENTIRESLKVTVRLAMQSWIRHGHWLYGFMNEGRRVCKSSDEQRCATEANCCLNYLGEFVCFVAWLFCAEEGIQFAAPDCCFVIMNAMEAELEKAYDDALDMKSAREADTTMREKYVETVKFRFLLSLDTEFSRPLQMNLGTMLALSIDLSTIISP